MAGGVWILREEVGSAVIVSTHNNLRADWCGSSRYGPMFAILRDGEIIHRGSRGFIALKWKKLTGQTLGTA